MRTTVEIPWQDWDLRDLAAEECDGRIEALARAEFGRAFDLATQLPMRVTLIRTGADQCVLLMVMHHIGWDDDCWDVFFGDLAAAYNGREQDSPAPQFISVGVLKNSGEPTESEVEYWRTTLRPLPEPVELPGPAVAAPSRRMDRSQTRDSRRTVRPSGGLRAGAGRVAVHGVAGGLRCARSSLYGR